MAASPLDRSAATPLWQQLLQDVQRRLDAGEFSAAFPGELELVAQYGVSRHTVREALRRLRAEGVVLAGRGQRPRLSERMQISQPLGALYSLFAAVEAAGLPQTSVVRALSIRTEAGVAARLGEAETTPLVYLERLRLAGGTPLALDQVWLPASLASPLLTADFAHTSLYGELASRAGVRLAGGQETIHAIVPSTQQRGLLAAPRGVAAFAIDRLGYTSAGPVEWRHTVVRGDRFNLTAEFSARTGYRLDVAGRALPSPHSAGRRARRAAMRVSS